MGSKYTEAQKQASMKYLADKTDDIRVRLPRGTKDRWKAAADSAGVSLTVYIRDAVEAAISATNDAIHTHAAQRSESVQAFILRAISETMYNDTHPRTMDSDREAMRKAFERFHRTE